MQLRTPLGVLPALIGITVLVACDRPRPDRAPVPLDIANRADATPWIAASGSFVAVAWGATQGGKTDVFVAVSQNAGATFEPPVQVNQVAGEARLGAEL